MSTADDKEMEAEQQAPRQEDAEAIPRSGKWPDTVMQRYFRSRPYSQRLVLVRQSSHTL
jgi:hypothetical protein